MSKIDVLIIVHNEQEGLLSVGNSERARVGLQPCKDPAVICRKGDTGSSGNINNILLLMFLNTIS